MHDVPTHLEIADKLVFGLTAGQTLFCVAGIFIGYSVWRHLLLLGMPILGSVPIAALVSVTLISLALIRPEQRSLDQWGFILFRYLLEPKVCLLAREDIVRMSDEPFEGRTEPCESSRCQLDGHVGTTDGGERTAHLAREYEAFEEVYASAEDPHTVFDPLGRFR